ncbi:MAG: ATP12 family chaperone protein [Marinibacterium sp.]
MSEWQPKRFWTDVTVGEVPDGFGIHLDGRAVRTPAKALLAVPTREMAEAIAEEWQAQKETVAPETMPFTRSANSAIDRVIPQRGEVADLIAAYGDSDLLCYRADGPDTLIARQCAGWDPALDWAEDVLQARLVPRQGIMHQSQPEQALARLTAQVHAMGPFHLTAFHDLVGLSGSLVLGFAAAAGWRPMDEIWTLSRIDEDFQAEQWGVDAEAAEQAALKRRDFLHAKRFFDLCGPR